MHVQATLMDNNTKQTYVTEFLVRVSALLQIFGSSITAKLFILDNKVSTC